MSFEHYPYDGCETPWKNLYQEPELITHIMKVWRDDGLPPGIPLLDTETNDHGGEAADDIFGALWLADSFGGFLSAGGTSTHYYHDLPTHHPILLVRTVGAPITCSWWTTITRSSSGPLNFLPRK